MGCRSDKDERLMRLARATLGAMIVLGCTTSVAPHFVLAPEVRLPRGPMRVVSPQYTGRIEASLREAGFKVVGGRDFEYGLRVELGINKQSKSDSARCRGRKSVHCGETRNVRYRLSTQGLELAELKARGCVSGCERNVFDEMGRVLAERFEPRPDQE